MVAHVAFEGLLSSVDPPTMLSQLVRQQETFAAPFAGMRPLVGVPGFLMQQQLVASDEGLAALAAVERGDAGVQGHVVLETPGSLETTRTLKFST